MYLQGRGESKSMYSPLFYCIHHKLWISFHLFTPVLSVSETHDTFWKWCSIIHDPVFMKQSNSFWFLGKWINHGIYTYKLSNKPCLWNQNCIWIIDNMKCNIIRNVIKEMWGWYPPAPTIQMCLTVHDVLMLVYILCLNIINEPFILWEQQQLKWYSDTRLPQTNQVLQRKQQVCDVFLKTAV